LKLRAENHASDNDATTASVIANAQGTEKRSSSNAARRVKRPLARRSAMRNADNSSASS
jgi:hypothetical protein